MQCARGKYYMLNCNDGRQKKLLHLSYLTKLATKRSFKPYCIQGSAESSLTATLDY